MLNSKNPMTMKSVLSQFTSAVNCIAINGLSNIRPVALEGATINIFSMSYFYNHDDKLLVFNTVNYSIDTLAYSISIASG